MNKRHNIWLHTIAAMLCCLVLSIGMTVFADEIPATVTVAANIRQTADTSSKVLAGVKNGDKLSICGQTTGTDGKVWYQVYVNADTKGFIRSDLVRKEAEGTITDVPNESAGANTNTAGNTSDTSVTPVEKRTGTVVTGNVRIRKGASTGHDVVATANKGMVLSVIGETSASDGKKWYQVSFTYNNKEITGFIRSDLVSFDSVPADSAVSQITGTEETPEAPETEPVTEEAPPEQPEEEPKEEPSASQDENANMILMNVDKEIYVLPEFTPVILKWEGQEINSYKNGKFYLFYAQKQSGEEGWYLYDSENGVYQRYVYDTADAVTPKNTALSGSLFPIIILIVVVVILLVVIALMFIKLREYGDDYYDDEEEEYDDEEADEEVQEEVPLEEEPVRQPPRRPAKRPAPSREQEEQQAQPPRRAPRGNVQPPRREPQGSAQPPRREPQGGSQPPRRAPQGGAQPQQRRPQPEAPARAPQNRPTKGNSAHKAKNFMETDDDMEFIDI